MSIEQIDGRGEYAYRIAPHDPCIVQARRNQTGARWYACRRYHSADDARQAVLAAYRNKPEQEAES